MIQHRERAIHTILGNNNLLLIVANGYGGDEPVQPENFLGQLGFLLTRQLGCYGVINTRYKKAILDLSNVEAVKTRKKITDTFLLQIREFKEEISGNDLLPQVVILQVGPPTMEAGAQLLLGYGQGERGVKERPHNPTLAPSRLSRFRLAMEDQQLSTAIAPTDSDYCGREPWHLNQLFRQKNYLDGFFDPRVRSLLLTIAPQLLSSTEATTATASALASALAQFSQQMALVRQIRLANIDATGEDDLQYIFRIPNDTRYNEISRESYIEELAVSIQRNGLLHPLVLLQKDDGRYKILCGFRRFQALSRLSQEWVEAKIFQEEQFSSEDFFNISLAENTRRRNLNPVEIGNFLDSASERLQLNNTMLAEQFGATLGIGSPGSKVSHSTIHKYRKVNQIRTRGESPEIINDIINDKLQFSTAAEVLAPIKDPLDRDSLYLEIIKPLGPTRPQLKKIIKLLAQRSTSLHATITSEEVRPLISQAMEARQRAATFIRLYENSLEPPAGKERQQQQQRLAQKLVPLRRRYFGDQACQKDFNLVAEPRAASVPPDHPDRYELRLRINKDNYQDILRKLETLLSKEDLLS